MILEIMKHNILFTVSVVILTELVIFFFYILLKRLSRSMKPRIISLDNDKMIEIGEWNMKTDEQITLNHGLDLDKIVSIDVCIQNDSGTSKYPLCYILNSKVSGDFKVTKNQIIFLRYPD